MLMFEVFRPRYSNQVLSLPTAFVRLLPHSTVTIVSLDFMHLLSFAGGIPYPNVYTPHKMNVKIYPNTIVTKVLDDHNILF